MNGAKDELDMDVEVEVDVVTPESPLHEPLNLVPVNEDPFRSPPRPHCNTDCGDRISTLDDDTALQILSLLPTNYSVQASTWSSRWNNLWKSSFIIDFDDEQNPNFEDFVDFTLISLDSTLKRKFSFKFSKEYGVALVDLWLAAAIRLNAKGIELHVRNWDIFELQLDTSDTSTCMSLTTLKLNIDGYLKVSSLLCLPTLKALQLNLRGFLNHQSVEYLLSNCPVLEELIIDSYPWDKLEVVHMSCPVLKRLVIKDRYLRSSKCRVVVDAPNLVSFKYEGYFAMYYSLEDSPLLRSASIDLDYSRSKWNDEHVPRVANLFRAVSSVRKMKITDRSMLTVLFANDEQPYLLPTFYNLEILEVAGIASSNCIKSLLCLLHNTPSLETLVFAAEFFCMEEKHLYSDRVPQCLQLHMKDITINNFHGNDEDIEFIKYLVKNAQVLEKMTITSSNKLARSEKQMEVHNKLSTLQKASERGVVLFS